MNTKITLILLIALIGLASCLKPETFPEEPAINFESFSILKDSGELVISFTDGNGDIGLNEDDTTGNFAPNKLYHHNLFIEYYEKDNVLGWVRGKDLSGEDISFLYRIPYLTPNGNNKALKGNIEIVIEPTYYNPLSSQSDTVKYRIKLVDRALNESNEIETPAIIR